MTPEELLALVRRRPEQAFRLKLRSGGYWHCDGAHLAVGLDRAWHVGGDHEAMPGPLLADIVGGEWVTFDPPGKPIPDLWPAEIAEAAARARS